MTQQETMNALESLVDATDAASVMLALARVCDEKAEHLVVNWQAKASSRPWSILARRLDKLAGDTNV